MLSCYPQFCAFIIKICYFNLFQSFIWFITSNNILQKNRKTYWNEGGWFLNKLFKIKEIQLNIIIVHVMLFINL